MAERADRVLIPLPDGRWLALAPDAFRAALAEGSALAEGAKLSAAPAPSAAASAPKLMSAEELEAATGVPASWFATQARERRLPFRKLGRYVRFNFEDLMACEAFQRRAISPGQLNCTGSRDRKGRPNA
jgi:hypothetical protein